MDRFGLKVTEWMVVTRKSKLAEVCPFVRDSLDYDFFWLADSDLTEDHVGEIADLLRAQIEQFKNMAPAHDPLATGKPAEFPTAWKTFFTIFPRARQESHSAKKFPVWDKLHADLKPEFVRHGLMLGQFYPGCPDHGRYCEEWKVPFVSPSPSFAIRYLIQDDSLFIGENTPSRPDYNKYFPSSGRAA